MKKCPACESPLLETPRLDCSSYFVHKAASEELVERYVAGVHTGRATGIRDAAIIAVGEAARYEAMGRGHIHQSRVASKIADLVRALVKR